MTDNVAEDTEAMRWFLSAVSESLSVAAGGFYRNRGTERYPYQRFYSLQPASEGAWTVSYLSVWAQHRGNTSIYNGGYERWYRLRQAATRIYALEGTDILAKEG